MASRRGRGNSSLSDHFNQGFANRLGQRAANRVPMRHPMPRPGMSLGGPAVTRRMAVAAPARVAVRPPMARPRAAARPALPPFGGLRQRY